MDYIIQNAHLKAVISSNGSELRELIDKDGINRMHIPNTNTWNRVSPILFPQISRMPNSEYMVNGETYNMTTHGFIRDKESTLVNQTNNEIVFMYKSDNNTFKIYPYEFVLYVTYKLIDNILEVNFKVENPSSKVLRYMLGGHPGFKVPLYDDEEYNDYSVVFEKAGILKRMLVVDGFLANKYEDYSLVNRTIELQHSLFENDALVFRNISSNFVDIISKNHNKKIRFHFSDFEILALWSKIEENANLLCLEPWNGIQKDFVREHEKMGVLEVAPNSFSCHSFKIEVI